MRLIHCKGKYLGYNSQPRSAIFIYRNNYEYQFDRRNFNRVQIRRFFKALFFNAILVIVYNLV